MKISRLLQFLLKPFMPMYIVDEGGGGGDDGEGDSEGGNLDGTSGTIGTGNDDRLRLMSQISDGVDDARSDELANVNDDGTTEPFKADGAPNADPEDLNNDDQVLPEDNPPQVQTIKVNGEEVPLTAELIEKAQKIASADKYLEEAATVRKAATSAPPPPAPSPSPEDAEAVGQDDDLALVRAIQMGTEEEAVAALRKIRASGRGTPDVAAVVDERLAFSNAINWFNTEYKDLVDDPQLLALVQQRDMDLVRNHGDKRSYRERYEQIGNEVRAWRDEMVTKYAPAPSPTPAAPAPSPKVERKAAAPATPKTATARATPTPADDEDGEENPQEVIANMAKARGGPQWARA